MGALSEIKDIVHAYLSGRGAKSNTPKLMLLFFSYFHDVINNALIFLGLLGV